MANHGARSCPKIYSNYYSFSIFFILTFTNGLTSATSLEALAVAESNSQLANSAYDILQNGRSENFVFSPFGLSIGLWMLTDAGARRETREEVKSGLKFGELEEYRINQGYTDLLSSFENVKGKTNDTRKFDLTFNNNLFVSRNFDLKYEFVTTVQNVWKSGVKSVNFSDTSQTVASVEEWFREQANGRLSSIFETEFLDDDLTSVLIGTANTFGPWKKKFARNSIREKPFFVNENERVKVQMMTQDDYFRHGDIPELDSTAVLLPLQEDRFSLIIILPNRRTGLNRAVERLKEFPFSNILGKLTRKWVELTLPKFKIQSTLDFVRNGLISKLGVRGILYESADFSGISCQSGIHLDRFVQSSLLEINEEGLGDTVPTFQKINSLRPVPRQAIRFFADHPFLMFVYDHLTKSILLVAQKLN